MKPLMGSNKKISKTILKEILSDIHAVTYGNDDISLGPISSRYKIG